MVIRINWKPHNGCPFSYLRHLWHLGGDGNLFMVHTAHVCSVALRILWFCYISCGENNCFCCPRVSLSLFLIGTLCLSAPSPPTPSFPPSPVPSLYPNLWLSSPSLVLMLSLSRSKLEASPHAPVYQLLNLFAYGTYSDYKGNHDNTQVA